MRACKAQLLAKQAGAYTVYVFYDVELYKYIMCTRLPNWEGSDIELDEVGYLSYKTVKAGEKYYNRNTGMHLTYNYSQIYFENFIRLPKIQQENIIL